MSTTITEPTLVSSGATGYITVVVPVRNEEPFIARTLDRLLAQDYPESQFETLVVDGESEDRTREIVSEYAERHDNVRLYDNPHLWSSAARNIGVRHARGDIIVVVDGHCELADDQFLRNLADAFHATGADCAGRPQPLDVSGANAFQRAVAAARSCWLGHHPDSHIYSSQEQFVPAMSVGVAYRRHVFEELGGFDERFDACEDVEFNYRVDRAGYRCYFAPRIAVRYCPRGNLRGLFRQLARYGRGRMRLLRKHPETLSIKSFLPGLFVLACIVGPGLAWLFPPLLSVYLGAILTYATIVLATSVAVAMGQRKLSLLSWLPLVFLAVHFGAGAGIIVEAICGAPRNSVSDTALSIGPSAHA
jgi:succinoglycan biosynthesis protein ExoA